MSFTIAMQDDTLPRLKQLTDKFGYKDRFHRYAGLLVQRSVQLNFQHGGRPTKWQPSMTEKTTGRKTMQPTGRLKASITFEADMERVVIGSPVSYARIQQEGGVVRPKSKKFLAIPVHPDAYSKRPRDFGEDFLFSIPDRGGLRLVHEERGGALTTYFLLRKLVRIPARPFLMLQESDKKRLEAWWEKVQEVDK